MVLPLDTMLTSTVSPALRAEGFKRKGRRFVIVNELGDLALIEISTSGKLALGDGYRHFWVRPWLLPEPFADLWRFRGAPYPVGWEQAVPLWDVTPRSPFGSSSPADALWAFKEDDPAHVMECGLAVVEALVPAVVAILRRLLDRETLVDEVGRADVLPILSRESSPLNLLFVGGYGRTLLPLLADAGDAAAVAGLMRDRQAGWLLTASREGNRYATSLIDWATARLAARGAGDLKAILGRPA
jgi:hypothetical protein